MQQARAVQQCSSVAGQVRVRVRVAQGRPCPPQLEPPGGVLLLVLGGQLGALVHQLAAHHARSQLLQGRLVDVVWEHLEEPLALAAAGAGVGRCCVIVVAGLIIREGTIVFVM